MGVTPIPNEIIAQYADGPNQLEPALKGLAETELDLALSRKDVDDSADCTSYRRWG